MEKIVLEEDTFNTVSKMLESPDEDTISTALMALEEMDFRKGTVFFALLFQRSIKTAGREALWQKHAPNLQKNLRNLGCDTIFSFRTIWDQFKDTASEGEKRVYETQIAPDFMTMLSEWGFKNLLKDMDIICKFKEK
jgi:hypothetical protein